MRLVGSEEELCRMFAAWMRLQHPDVADLGHFDYGSGTKLTMGQARKQKALNKRAWPDYFLAVPSIYNGQRYNGLFMEFKREGTRLTKRDGTPANDHIAEQLEHLKRLAEAGYIATFVCGFTEATETVNSYLKAGYSEVAA